MTVRIRRIAVQGFRSFGKARQSFNVSNTITVLWGGNSQGKTSLTEAVEFLITGQIARRDLLVSAKDEFAEALRNAHLDPQIPTSVEADFACKDGRIRTVTRSLLEDYRKGSAAGCRSTVTVDGRECSDAEFLEQVGLTLSAAPIRAPVLSQSTLSYLFSAAPAERAAYFRAVLDTEDIERFRQDVARLLSELTRPSLPLVDQVTSLDHLPTFKGYTQKILEAGTKELLDVRLADTIGAALSSAGIKPKEDLPARADQLRAELEKRRQKTFPVELMARSSFAMWERTTQLQSAIQEYQTERDRVAAEVRHLVDLFTAALNVPGLADGEVSDCPLCDTPLSITPERMSFLKAQVEATGQFSAAEKKLGKEVDRAISSIELLDRTVIGACPKFLHTRREERLAAGFSLARVRELAEDDALVLSWGADLRTLVRGAKTFRRTLVSAKRAFESAKAKLDRVESPDEFEGRFDQIARIQVDFQRALSAYAGDASRLGTRLQNAVAEATKTQGWDTLLDLAGATDNLLMSIEELRVANAERKALQAALSDIDGAAGKVLDEKFQRLSGGVSDWWNLLRPDESTFFASVQRRSTTAKRTIDLRVGLAATADRTNPKMRDAVAVLSQSQLHCLGLSLFLARVEREGHGFVFLDDPVLSSDDDYKPNFAASVIEALLDRGIQVLVATQDHGSWKDIGHRYAHSNVVQMVLVLNDPVEGTEVRGQSDDLAGMLARIGPLVKSPDPGIRKDAAAKLREALERFCKVLIVKDRQTRGETLASITDYDGSNFSKYGDRARALLISDPSHPGKLTAAHNYVTPGPHDDTPPTAAHLTVAYGDLKRFKKEYLD